MLFGMGVVVNVCVWRRGGITLCLCWGLWNRKFLIHFNSWKPSVAYINKLSHHWFRGWPQCFNSLQKTSSRRWYCWRSTPSPILTPKFTASHHLQLHFRRNRCDFCAVVGPFEHLCRQCVLIYNYVQLYIEYKCKIDKQCDRVYPLTFQAVRVLSLPMSVCL